MLVLKLWYLVLIVLALHAAWLRARRVRLRSTSTTGRSKKRAESAGASLVGNPTQSMEPAAVCSSCGWAGLDTTACPSPPCLTDQQMWNWLFGYGETTDAGAPGVVVPEYSHVPEQPAYRTGRRVRPEGETQ